ncbi:MULTISPECIES: rhodanese-like domain-containing protein [Alteribacter]|uniref:Rhodanese-like domain-containing protein n=1 Tax=Alteribacter keqinensis TaxID=2483800 RepID=A0A3M7TTJ6_9BACI|nr:MULTISPECIES: rhodanese-like domain-containing protein [Alteribacter]MBM7097307.1 rhodanese-like domain-containing protein [Alteribacter salitolerans]RNA68960.1 rhodanese-like domain-containing protein [Alteribacter keqinensis]
MTPWILAITTVILIFFIVSRVIKPKYLRSLETEEFKKDYRKAQLIDIREEKEFNTGHILGARNIPLSQLRQRQTEIRPDKPVYIYCQSGARCIQAAKVLKKKRGAEDIVQLKGGFRKWTGKIKK